MTRKDTETVLGTITVGNQNKRSDTEHYKDYLEYFFLFPKDYKCL